jgi:acetyl-CoA synthase
MHCEFGGQRTPAFEWLYMRDLEEVEDGRVELHGPDSDTVEPGGQLPLGIVIEVAGRKMQADFEPVLERQVHTFTNEAQGIWHMGQRDINWLRISNGAFKAGFRLEHIGKLLHAKDHDEYSKPGQGPVKLYTKRRRARIAQARAGRIRRPRCAPRRHDGR